jgi:hypothetical protein
MTLLQWLRVDLCLGAASHILLDVPGRIAHGVSVALDILAGALDGVAGGQSADRDQKNQCYRVLCFGSGSFFIFITCYVSVSSVAVGRAANSE